MILRASDIGELVAAQMESAQEGRVTRVFRRSAYVETGEGLILLHQGELRSPMTVNLGAEACLERLIFDGGACVFLGQSMEFEEFSISTGGAGVYKSPLLRSAIVDVLESRELVKGVAMLSLLYDVSPASLDILGSGAFRAFVQRIIRPLGRGDLSQIHLPENYLPLIGLGNGFTPAGDDLVAGYLATFNHAVKSLGIKEILLPRDELLKRTVPESARMLDYTQRGHVDEDLSRLILSAVSDQHDSFEGNLLEVACRGHTSGIDTSLGVMLASASVAEILGRSRASEVVIDALARLRTL